jgi:DNA-binding response OmpR family regulator
VIGVKILVIEDEAQIREEVSDWLQFEGYETVTAANGRLGLAAVEQENPDLIMCDITMPQMDGYEVLIEVRANQKHATTPFIFLTAAADRDSLRKGMGLGADDYLTKPFTLQEVLGAIRTRLQRQAAQTQQGQHDILEDRLAETGDANQNATHMLHFVSPRDIGIVTYFTTYFCGRPYVVVVKYGGIGTSPKGNLTKPVCCTYPATFRHGWLR